MPLVQWRRVVKVMIPSFLSYFQLSASFLAGFTVSHSGSLFRLGSRKCYGEFVQFIALPLLSLLPRAALLFGLTRMMSYLGGSNPYPKASAIVLHGFGICIL